MHYVLSDIHGEYQRYRKMLDKIQFKDEDTLYVLGDVIDRGDAGLKILFDMMIRPNVFPILGNHEYMMGLCSKFLLQEITEKSVTAMKQNGELLWELIKWVNVGGSPTISEMLKLSLEKREDILDYLEKFALFAEVSVAGKSFVLVHAGLSHFSPERSLDSYQIGELLFRAPRYDEKYFTEKYLITGHLPTRAIRNSYEDLFLEEKDKSQDSIIIMNNHIAIDCGCGYDGRLGCLCLETFEEFYV